VIQAVDVAGEDCAQGDGLRDDQADADEDCLGPVQQWLVPPRHQQGYAHDDQCVGVEVAGLDIEGEERRPLHEADRGPGQQDRTNEAENGNSEGQDLPAPPIRKSEQDHAAHDSHQNGPDRGWQLVLHGAHTVEVRRSRVAS